MSKELKYFHFVQDPYDQNIIVVCGKITPDSIKQFKADMKKEKVTDKICFNKVIKEIYVASPSFDGLTAYSGTWILIYIEDKRDINVIAHEVLHAVNGTLLARGLELSHQTSEAYCYLQGHLTEKIVNKFKKIK